jgi:type I restriction enzyme, R subunit
VQQSQVKGAGLKRQLTDLIALVRYAIGLDSELQPYAEQVNRRWQEWIFRHNARRGTALTAEQTEWLRLIKDHIAASCAIARNDFDYAPFADKGGLQKAWGLFGSELDGLMKEMNEELAA